MKTYNRRSFIDFLGKGTVGVAVLPSFIACSDDRKVNDEIEDKESVKKEFENPFIALSPSDKDEVLLSKGLSYDLLIKWADEISNEDYFGFNCDYILYNPIHGSSDGILWVNHEYIDRQFISGNMPPNIDSIRREQYNVGGTLMRVLKDKDNNWSVAKGDEYNRRISGQTEIPFNWDEEIEGSKSGIGTLGNCAGGKTPWGNILTCEENYQGFYGETVYDENNNPSHADSSLGWEDFFPDNKPEHYGWVVEVNPRTGEAQKHIALGRFCHECATVKELPDGRVVVYSGDDGNDRCLYKFIGSRPQSLKEGTLYVANVEEGKWVSLNYDDQPILQEKFNNQTEVLVRAREASYLVGGSKLARPEDIEIDPVTGNILISLTNNTSKDDYFGQIFKMVEKDNNYESLEFESDTFLAGGEEIGFCCPDNMEFDVAGNLWFTSDVSGGSMHKEPYTNFKNNGLFFVPRKGKDAGKVIRVANAPIDAEFTGPQFTPDGKTLFLSVQHPGEYSEGMNGLTSHWPEGGTNIPKPTVITIQGEALDYIAQFKLED